MARWLQVAAALHLQLLLEKLWAHCSTVIMTACVSAAEGLQINPLFLLILPPDTLNTVLCSEIMDSMFVPEGYKSNCCIYYCCCCCCC
jgi:hypothetical protein